MPNSRTLSERDRARERTRSVLSQFVNRSGLTEAQRTRLQRTRLQRTRTRRTRNTNNNSSPREKQSVERQLRSIRRQQPPVMRERLSSPKPPTYKEATKKNYFKRFKALFTRKKKQSPPPKYSSPISSPPRYSR